MIKYDIRKKYQGESSMSKYCPDCGYNNNDSVEDKSFSYSIRYWDFSEIFKSKGAIVPDIIVENTIEDLENNYDRVLKKAFEILKVN